MPAMVRRIDASGKQAEGATGDLGCALGQVGPIQQHRLVVREVAQVVFEQHQAVVGDLRIGGVGHGDVDTAAGDAAVGEVVVQPLDPLLGQPIAARAPASRRRGRGTRC
jgi:hypothetical protein